ncbi:MAG: hypothetical protein HZA93_27395 [Verrucomicrobia bacterium]|nr:hypothetical protein [Verrucomicrobiota bacterium]
MFNVTVVNLTADARHAAIHSGPCPLGQLSADELVGLLQTFAEIDPVENNDADPEIRVEQRRQRFVIRTAQKKLFLHNPRDLNEPAYVVSAREIIEELDGTAAARRTPPPFAYPTDAAQASGGSAFPQEIAPTPLPGPRSRPIGLIALVFVLAGYVAYAELTRHREGQAPALTPLTATELAAEEPALTGAYMTGAEPGQHGIVVLGSGKLELFQVNARGGPGTVHGTYQLGRKDGGLRLATDQPGGMIAVSSRDTLEFCGETYKRVRGR